MLATGPRPWVSGANLAKFSYDQSNESCQPGDQITPLLGENIIQMKKNTAVVFAISIIVLVVCISSCFKNSFETHFAMKLPNDAEIAHYENRSGFVDSSHIMVLRYNKNNVPDLIIQNLKLKKFISRNGVKAGVISSEWPSWWQPEIIYRIADIYERLDSNEFAWFWFERENNNIYVQWGTY